MLSVQEDDRAPFWLLSYHVSVDPAKSPPRLLTLLSCLCKAEFCYQGGAKWKECACDIWDEEAAPLDSEAGPLDWGEGPLDWEEVHPSPPRFQGRLNAEKPDLIDEEALPLEEARQAGAEPPQEEERLPIEGMLEGIRLEEQQICRHPDCSPVPVGGKSQRGVQQRCDLCLMTMKRFLLRCTQCHMKMCVRCRRNRLR